MPGNWTCPSPRAVTQDNAARLVLAATEPVATPATPAGSARPARAEQLVAEGGQEPQPPEGPEGLPDQTPERSLPSGTPGARLPSLASGFLPWHFSKLKEMGPRPAFPSSSFPRRLLLPEAHRTGTTLPGRRACFPAGLSAQVLPLARGRRRPPDRVTLPRQSFSSLLCPPYNHG